MPHPFSLQLDNPKTWWVYIMKLLISHFLVPVTRWGRYWSVNPNIFLNTLFTSTLSPCFSLNVRGQVPYSYKTTEKIALPYILAFILLHSK
jgi:hypothetical protein